MKVLVDMNLGLGFVAELQALGIEARDWSQVGALDAPEVSLWSGLDERALWCLPVIN
ncbi:MAG: hypothetical protein RLZZ582_1239 [Verrucomicrobiota bacterium]|jgi:predicted nuclease of predicted toxin-antitoxin system